MNINEFAKKICDIEEGKKQVDIAQVKEILSIINNYLGNYYTDNIFYSLIEGIHTDKAEIQEGIKELKKIKDKLIILSDDHLREIDLYNDLKK
jgi:ribosomal 50S subunit-associated protein YjgA (DUF615 family)